MAPARVSSSPLSATLSAALRAIRRLRRRRVVELARALELPQRSYEHFEAGKGRLNVERVRQFAEVTDSDAYALLASLWILSPDFAVRCADNKFMTILVMALQDFDREAGDGLATLDGQTLIATFEQMFQRLLEEIVRRRPDEWIEGRARAEGKGQPSE